MLIAPKLVFERRYYLKADRETYELSVSLLKALGVRVSEQRARVQKLISNFDKAFWLPKVPEINDIYPIDNGISGYEVVHQAMHSLVAFKYGHSLNKKPRLCVLSEGLAGATELYYSAKFIANGGQREKSPAFLQYDLSARLLGCGFAPKFNKFLEDPFSAFRANALASAELSDLLLVNLQHATDKKKVDLRFIEKKIKQNPQFVFLMHKDFGNFALFVMNYCGSHSNRQDREDVADCKRILNSSTSLLDFMVKMGALKIIKNAKPSIKRAA